MVAAFSSSDDVRIERAVLTNHRHVALGPLEIVDDLISDTDLLLTDLSTPATIHNAVGLPHPGRPNEDPNSPSST
jgi:hypothetical protein